MFITPEVSRAAKVLKTPFMIMDLQYVRNNYFDIVNHVSNVQVFYAVKANSHPRVIELLSNLGSNFDVASRGEIDKLLSIGVSPERMSFGNTIKKVEDIAYAAEVGVKYFAVDSEMEVEKIAAHAPGSLVYGRIATSGGDSDWPLSRKFGTDIDHIISIMDYADKLGLDAYGVSFHVGSQNYNPENWEIAIRDSSKIFDVLRSRGINIRMLNLGGGMPVKHVREIPSVGTISQVINKSIENYLGSVQNLEIFIEPGRSMVGHAGIMASQVVLRSKKGNDEWVYLDAGVFHGLAETIEDFRYEVLTEGKIDDKKKNFKLAGPTCDSVDTIYESVALPKSIGYGDIVYFINTGAYTVEYGTHFNGIEPPYIVFVEEFAVDTVGSFEETKEERF